MKTKLISAFLAIVLVFSMFPTAVFAAEPSATGDPSLELKIPEFTVGERQEFTVTTNGTYSDNNVLVKFSFERDNLDNLEYFATELNDWRELIGDTFGPSETGFPYTDGATSKFRATFKEAGDFALSIQVFDVVTNEIVTEATTTVRVICSHKNLEAIPSKPATCTEDGNIAYWHCAACGKYFSNAQCTEEIDLKDTILKAGHTVVKTEAKEPTATEDGNIEYWQCSVCGKYFRDEACKEEITKEQTVIPATGGGNDRPGGGNGNSGGGSGRPLPSDGSSTGPTFESDTTYDLTVNGVYQFRITSLNGAAPVMTLSNGNFRVELASQSGNDYFFKVYVVNPGQSCDVIVNGQKVVTVTAAAGVISDTTAPFTVAQGGTYQFKLTAAQQPAFVAGSPCFTVEYAGNIGNDWFYKVHAVGEVGEASGFYINGAPAPVAVATIG